MRALLAEQNQKMQLLLEEVAQLRAEISSAKKVPPSTCRELPRPTAAKRTGAAGFYGSFALPTLLMLSCSRIFPQETAGLSKGLRARWSSGCQHESTWPAVTMQHIYKDVSPSGTVASAPRDVAVFGVDADGEEETLLGTFTYNVAKEAIQTFPLKDAPLPRAFSYIKLLVKSNWGNPAYTCIYRVQVHGKMAAATREEKAGQT
ncbi:uncharacterized protein LOC115335313 isoform X3 [Aquila chrysaetos chrysaetos]|uniref:uncharacterized protein LOC115335313 isoform X3 n=1 Tax=Aquila chrysaetos chrysaetos TaxID=223781 RepID=UPI001B7D2C93|nr:uncharacterized protein LOC115335313 isoform X3 [Aquila chrysaetos chrysaetos]